MSDTPRTDAAHEQLCEGDLTMREHAEKLERELNSMTRERDGWKALAERLAGYKLDPQQQTMKTLGQIAYEGYLKASGGRSLISGAVLPSFSELSFEMRTAWKAAGNAVENEVAGLNEAGPRVDDRTFERRRRDGAVSKLKLLSRVMADLREDTAGSDVLTQEETSALDAAYAQLGKIV